MTQKYGAHAAQTRTRTGCRRRPAQRPRVRAARQRWRGRRHPSRVGLRWNLAPSRCQQWWRYRPSSRLHNGSRCLVSPRPAAPPRPTRPRARPGRTHRPARRQGAAGRTRPPRRLQCNPHCHRRRMWTQCTAAWTSSRERRRGWQRRAARHPTARGAGAPFVRRECVCCWGSGQYNRAGSSTQARQRARVTRDSYTNCLCENRVVVVGRFLSPVASPLCAGDFTGACQIKNTTYSLHR